MGVTRLARSEKKHSSRTPTSTEASRADSQARAHRGCEEEALVRARGTSGILNFNGFAQTTNGSILNITNWVGTLASLGGGGAEQLLFVGSASTFSSTFTQSEIQFDGVAGYALVDHTTWFKVTPVPEPSTWIAGGLAVFALGFMQRRRLAKLAAGS